ncbi:LacI family DNA-binding transcriptional regulator [Anaerosporobacter faecicola]|uniref:LacI family DNA-binding transcriptional regulator n=1 Tax=Anaerosporobacter faecicola TaxID=2718714 RepID=UPI00143B4A0D|nr:LacI family DNA-binding transcriptional regulator [Anaerosporobacter faecicola]
MATLKDIAAEAGVSVMTVSNVINGNHKKVSQTTIQLINDLVKKYNYVPNLSARSLTSKSSKLIAIILSNSDPLYNYFTNPYLSELFGEIETLVRKNGYFTIIRSVLQLDNVSDILKNWNVDGAIFLTHQEESAIDHILDTAPCPIVFVDSYTESNKNALVVGTDDFKGGYIATKHFIQNGHKKIAFAGPYSETNKIIAHRFEGYLAALKEANLPYQEDYLICTNTSYEDGLVLGREIANRKLDITAIFTTADILAIGLMEGAKCNGCFVPNDLSLIGFDGLQLCNLVSPKLTSVSQNVQQKADSCVQLLLKAMNSKHMKGTTVTLDVELAIRQTCNPCHN